LLRNIDRNAEDKGILMAGQVPKIMAVMVSR
jgi:hypothetical protein